MPTATATATAAATGSGRKRKGVAVVSIEVSAQNEPEIQKEEGGAKKRAGKTSKTEKKVEEIVEEPAQPVEAEPLALITAAQKKKATKKPVKVVAVVTSEGIEGSFTPEPRRPLIAHLQIKPSEVRFTESNDTGLSNGNTPSSNFVASNEPMPYDPSWQIGGFNTDNNKSVSLENPELNTSGPKSIQAEPQSIIQVQVQNDTKAPPCFSKYNLMVQYKEYSEQKMIPDRTDVACFWCAHTFEWQPCIIPEREVNGVYNVYGNFCTPECGVAFLLSEPIDPHVRWERMALLQRIYDQEGKGRVCPAPARESLRLFGGPLTIESFRSAITEKKVRIDLHMPPMVSILGSIDTKPIDFFDINTRNGGPVALQPQRPVEEGLRLKRTKPLKDRESTLDTVMNIRIGSSKKA